jgi:hypothetical protein
VILDDTQAVITTRSDGYWEINLNYDTEKPSRLKWTIGGQTIYTDFPKVSNQKFSDLNRILASA